MLINFTPKFTISPKIASCLLRIEAAKQQILHLPLTPMVIASLRETARLYTTHYSTMIEGNRLGAEEIAEVIKQDKHFAGRERDEKEVKGYFAALKQMELWIAEKVGVTETQIRTLHALVMGDGRSKVTPTPYRDGQNVIRDSMTKAIVYMPPEAKDVPGLIHGLVQWISQSAELPCPIIAAIAHYQFATIHPYYDGNGRCARLLATFVLHLGGFDLKGLYSLEEYYARDLHAYYAALTIGPSHNYYLGRAESDITRWIEYFIEGMAFSFESVLKGMLIADQRGEHDQAELFRKLDPKQRQVLELFYQFELVTAHQIGALFKFKPRTAAQLCKKWVDQGFLEIVNFSNKARSYCLGKKHALLLR